MRQSPQSTSPDSSCLLPQPQSPSNELTRQRIVRRWMMTASAPSNQFINQDFYSFCLTADSAGYYSLSVCETLRVPLRRLCYAVLAKKGERIRPLDCNATPIVTLAPSCLQHRQSTVQISQCQLLVTSGTFQASAWLLFLVSLMGSSHPLSYSGQSGLPPPPLAQGPSVSHYTRIRPIDSHGCEDLLSASYPLALWPA